MQVILDNKKARFNYETIHEFDAGIELRGLEVKSLREGQGSLIGSHVTVRGGETFLLNALISPYQEKNTPKDYEPRRNRRLLVTKKEMAILAGYEKKKGLTIIPLLMYNKERKIKVRLAVVRGKKLYDKREDLKKRDTEREMRRTLKKNGDAPA